MLGTLYNDKIIGTPTWTQWFCCRAICGIGGAFYVWLHRQYVMLMRNSKTINSFLKKKWVLESLSREKIIKSCKIVSTFFQSIPVPGHRVIGGGERLVSADDREVPGRTADDPWTGEKSIHSDIFQLSSSGVLSLSLSSIPRKSLVWCLVELPVLEPADGRFIVQMIRPTTYTRKHPGHGTVFFASHLAPIDSGLGIVNEVGLFV